jgi:hypothetical protein
MRAPPADVVSPGDYLHRLSTFGPLKEAPEGGPELRAIALPAEKMEAYEVVTPESYHGPYSLSDGVIEFE